MNQKQTGMIDPRREVSYRVGSEIREKMDVWENVLWPYKAASKRENTDAVRFGVRMLELIERLRSEFSLDQVRVFTEHFTLVLSDKTSERYVYLAWDGVDSRYKISRDFFHTSEDLPENEIIPRIKAYLELEE